MNSLGKNYLAAVAVFFVVLWLLLERRSAELDHLAPTYGVNQAQAQEEALQPLAPTTDLKPPTATLETPAPASPTAPSIDLSPRPGQGS